MKEREKMRVLKEHFQSIYQMLEIIDGRPNNEVMQEEDSSHSGDQEFTLTESWNQAIDLFQYGYTDILEELKTGMKKHAKFQTATNRRKMKTAVHGVVPHVPHAILGLPNSMIHIESEIQKVKAISLVYSITANCGTDAQEFVRSGIATLSAIHALELRGYRVNLKIMFFNAKSDEERAFGTVNVKHYREHLDLHKLCFPVAHPSMFRRIGFKWLETFPELKDHDWSDGYGSQLSTEEFLEIEGLLQKNEHYLSLDILEECNYNVDEIIEYLNIK